VSRFIKIFLFVVLSVFSGTNLSANSTFFSIENKGERVYSFSVEDNHSYIVGANQTLIHSYEDVNGHITNDVTIGYKRRIGPGGTWPDGTGSKTLSDDERTEIQNHQNKLFSDLLKNKNPKDSFVQDKTTATLLDGKGVDIKEVSFWETISSTTKTVGELLEQFQIPGSVYDNVDAHYDKSIVNASPFMSGIGNGAIDQIKEIPQLAVLVTNLVIDKSVRNGLITSFQSLTLTKVKEMRLKTLSKTYETLTGKDDKAWHEKGKTTYELASAIFGEAFVKRAKEGLTNLTKVTTRLDDISGSAFKSFTEARKNLANKFKRLDEDVQKTFTKNIDDIADKNIRENLMKKLDASDLTDAEFDRFAKLSKNNTNLLNESSLDEFLKISKRADADDIVESWAFVKKNKTDGSVSKLLEDFDVMKVIQRQTKPGGLMDKVGKSNYENIIKNYAGKCTACDALPGSAEFIKHLPPHDVMLKNLETFATKHMKPGGGNNIDKVFKDLASGNAKKQKGAEYVTRILKDQDGIKSFEYKYMDGVKNNTADWVTVTGKKVDGKSWSVSGSIDKIGGWDFSNQLKDYFTNGNFEQWFDYSRFKKSDLSKYSGMSKAQAAKHVKEQYQKLFKKDVSKYWKELEESGWFIKNNILKKADFINSLKDVSSPFFDFIKVM